MGLFFKKKTNKNKNKKRFPFQLSVLVHVCWNLHEKIPTTAIVNHCNRQESKRGVS